MLSVSTALQLPFLRDYVLASMNFLVKVLLTTSSFHLRPQSGRSRGIVTHRCRLGSDVVSIQKSFTLTVQRLPPRLLYAPWSPQQLDRLLNFFIPSHFLPFGLSRYGCAHPRAASRHRGIYALLLNRIGSWVIVCRRYLPLLSVFPKVNSAPDLLRSLGQHHHQRLDADIDFCTSRWFR